MQRDDRGGLWILTEKLQPSAGSSSITQVQNTPRELREVYERYEYIFY